MKKKVSYSLASHLVWCFFDCLYSSDLFFFFFCLHNRIDWVIIAMYTKQLHYNAQSSNQSTRRHCYSHAITVSWEEMKYLQHYWSRCWLCNNYKQMKTTDNDKSVWWVPRNSKMQCSVVVVVGVVDVYDHERIR